MLTGGGSACDIFEGETAEPIHPRYIEKDLNTGTYTGSGTEYADYATGMLQLLQSEPSPGGP